MPILDTFIPETTKQIINPVSEQIGHKILEILGLKQLFQNSFFPKSEATDTSDSSKFKDEKDNMRLSKNRCDMFITPNYNPADTAWNVFRSKDTDIHASTKRGTFGEYPIFYDKKADIFLNEVSVPCSVELNFKMKLKSIELADLVSSTIYSKAMSTGSVYDYNDIIFTYPIADKTLIMLYKMFSMQDILGDCTFPNYLKIGSNAAIDILLNRDQLEGGPKEVIIKRTEVDVLGKMEYGADTPDGEKVNKIVDRYTVEFKYIFQFGKPSLLRLQHPIMINNKLLGSGLVRKPVPMGDPTKKKYHPNININKFYVGKTKRVNLRKSYPLIRYPDYDEWIPASSTSIGNYNKYMPIFIGVLAVTVDQTTGNQSLYIDIKKDIFPIFDPLLVLELTETVKLSDRVSVLRREDIFNISVFSNNNVVSFNNLDLSEDLFLNVNTNIDIMRVYRLVISIIIDINILPAKHIYYMLDHPDYFKYFLEDNVDYLQRNKYINIIRDDLTQTDDLKLPARFTQSPTIGVRHAFGRAITFGRYVVEVRH